MTASEGGRVVSGAAAAGPAGHRAAPGVTVRSPAPLLRTVLSLARAEASRLARSLLILAGLLAGGAAVWLTIRSAEPLWWNVGWRIGLGQVFLGMTVLVAAQLAAGRARRNAMTDLYASFPTSAGTRTLAHLAGLLGAVPASLVLIGATVVVVQLRGAIGTPSIAVLAGGLLLVVATGAVGIAIGTRFSHPLAGMLGALVLFASSANSGLPWAAGLWLYPWASFGDQLGSLPGPLAEYPPAGAHALELAGLAVLAGVVALAITLSRPRARGPLAAAGIVALAAICLAGALQLRPIPTADLNRLVSEVSNPASAQHCTTDGPFRYCLYPAFGRDLAGLEAPVNAVLAELPARPTGPQIVTIRQVAALSLPDSTLTHGHPSQQVSEWDARVQRAPGNASAAPPSTVYLPVGSWPAAGGQLSDAHFELALTTAEWAVRIPARAVGSPPQQASGSPGSQVPLACVPAGQAREAIAIWLAILATHPSAGELHAGLPSHGGFTAVQVGSSLVPTWMWGLPVSSLAIVPPGGVPQTTEAGYLLASAMTRLPEQRVTRVLTDAWARWLNWHTTDAQLAAALGIPVPKVPVAPQLPQNPGGEPVAPLCAA